MGTTRKRQKPEGEPGGIRVNPPGVIVIPGPRNMFLKGKKKKSIQSSESWGYPWLANLLPYLKFGPSPARHLPPCRHEGELEKRLQHEKVVHESLSSVQGDGFLHRRAELDLASTRKGCPRISRSQREVRCHTKTDGGRLPTSQSAGFSNFGILVISEARERSLTPRPGSALSQGKWM